jgi:hypothetical protein
VQLAAEPFPLLLCPLLWLLLPLLLLLRLLWLLLLLRLLLARPPARGVRLARLLVRQPEAHAPRRGLHHVPVALVRVQADVVLGQQLLQQPWRVQ